jgi:hypothetical protein
LVMRVVIKNFAVAIKRSMLHVKRSRRMDVPRQFIRAEIMH